MDYRASPGTPGSPATDDEKKTPPKPLEKKKKK
jgi:hypothetical protein